MNLKLVISTVAVMAFSATVFLAGRHLTSGHSGPITTVQPAQQKTQLNPGGTHAFDGLMQQGKGLHLVSESNMSSTKLKLDNTNLLNKSDMDALYGRDSQSKIRPDLVKKPAASVFDPEK